MATSLEKYISKEIQGSVEVGTVALTSALTTVAITGIAGEFSCDPTTLVVGQTISISGTFGGTGSITGYVDPTTYVVSVTDGSTTFTLTEVGGVAVETTAGTPTGLTYTLNREYIVGEVITGGTSLATARIVKIEGTGESTVLTFDSIGGAAMFEDGETVVAGTSGISAVVDIVAGDLPVGSIGGTTAATATTIIATSAGIVQNQVTGSRLRQEVLVASRDFATKQAV